MKTRSIFVCLLLAATLALSAGCGGGQGQSELGEDVYVTVVDAGFGSGWMEAVADAYYEETGIIVHVASDPQLVNGVETKMGTTAEKDDIYFVAQGQSNWLKWTAQDLIEPLDDVLTSDKYGTPAADRYSREAVVAEMGVFDGTSYLLPYIYSMWGLVYRQNYLDQIPSHGDYVQGGFPTTMQGLIDLCTAVREAELVNPRTSRTVMPFSAGLTVNYMDYLFFALWNEADPEGYEAYWEQNDRSAFDGSRLDTAAALGAMEVMYDLIGATSAEDSNLVSTGQNHTEAQTSFINGDCVFTFSGTWFESEMTSHFGIIRTSL